MKTSDMYIKGEIYRFLLVCTMHMEDDTISPEYAKIYVCGT